MLRFVLIALAAAGALAAPPTGNSAKRTQPIKVSSTVNLRTSGLGGAGSRGSLNEVLRNIRYCTDMRPDCTCKDMDRDRPAVECSNVTDIENLKHIFGSRSSWYSSLTMRNSHVGYLPSSSFGTTQFESYD